MTNKEVVRLAHTFDLQTYLVRMVVVEIAKKWITWRAVTSNAALSVQRELEFGRNVSQKSQSTFAEQAASKSSSDLGKMLIGFGAARIRIMGNRPVVISLEEPTSLLKRCDRPGDAFDRLRAIVDQIAETKDVLVVGFGGENCLQGNPIGMNIRNDENLHALTSADHSRNGRARRPLQTRLPRQQLTP